MTGSHFDAPHPDDLFTDALRQDAPGPRTLRPRAGRVLVAATSLAVGAVAAGGTAMAIGHGPQDLSVSNAAARSSLDKGASDGDANAPGVAKRLGDGAGDDDREGDDVSRTPRPERPKPHADRCIKLDAKVLAAIAVARKNGSAGPVTADKKAVYVPVKAVKVVSCKAARTPRPTTTSGRATPTVTTTTAAPSTTTKTTTAPKTTTPKTTTPKTTTTKPAPKTTTTTAAS